MAAPRIRRVKDRRDMEVTRDDFITQGYEVRSEGEETILLRKSTWGGSGTHVLIFLLTAWWTAGVGNLVYALYAHNSADQVLLKPEEVAA